MGSPAERPRPGRGQPSPLFVRRTWPADAYELGPIRAELRDWLGPLDMSADARNDVVFAVSEAVSNTIAHAYPGGQAAAGPAQTVEITMWTEPGALYIEVVDHGTWREPTGSSGFSGIDVIQRVIESVLIHYDPRGTRVMLRHALPGQALPPPASGTN